MSQLWSTQRGTSKADLLASTRLYRSGNPFKRPCPLGAFTHTRAEFDAIIEGYEAHAVEPTDKPEGKGAKGKLTVTQSNQYKRVLKSKEDEEKLAMGLRELIPGIEKEEQVSHSCPAFVDSSDVGSECKERRSEWQLLSSCRKWPNGEVRGRDGRRERSITHTMGWVTRMAMAM